jgi:hypothetical protein
MSASTGALARSSISLLEIFLIELRVDSSHAVLLLCGSVPGCALRHRRQSITAAWLRHSDGGVCQYRNSQQAEQDFLFHTADNPRVELANAPGFVLQRRYGLRTARLGPLVVNHHNEYAAGGSRRSGTGLVLRGLSPLRTHQSSTTHRTPRQPPLRSTRGATQRKARRQVIEGVTHRK